MDKKVIGQSSTGLEESSLIQVPTVETENGLIEGLTKQSVDSFKGIPFAAPPINDLRWRAPQPVKNWSGVLKATEYGFDCMQKPFPSDEAPMGESSLSEDCLYLNVWKPNEVNAGDKKPVMIWIYGGGFVNGGASPAIYDASHFAEQGIVAVSFNYRVGRFGFFAHPALTAENKDSATGNFGYMDQIAALKWVKRNIASFGGDPDNITVVGESAGGLSIHFLLTSSMADGLFNKAIIQSGSGRKNMTARNLNTTNERGLPSAESVGLEFAKKHNISGTDSTALQQLRALSAEEITDGLNMLSMMDPTYSGPMIDGKLCAQEPEQYYVSGEKLNIPLLIGATNNEIGFPPPVDSDEEALKPFCESNFAAALSAYHDTGAESPQEIAKAIASDVLMVEPARFVLREAAKQTSDVYGYRFAYVADSLKSSCSGAPHAYEIPYVFNTVKSRYDNKLTDNDDQMSLLIHQYWVNFIKFGDPNGNDLPSWQPYNETDDNIMWFSNKGVDDTHMVEDPWRNRLDLVEQIQ